MRDLIRLARACVYAWGAYQVANALNENLAHVIERERTARAIKHEQERREEAERIGVEGPFEYLAIIEHDPNEPAYDMRVEDEERKAHGRCEYCEVPARFDDAKGLPRYTPATRCYGVKGHQGAHRFTP